MPTAPPSTRSLELAWPDGRREPLRLADAPFAEGGDARLFDVVGRRELVAKMYREPAAEPRRRAKLEAMLAVPPAGRTARHRGVETVQLAWPAALVEDEQADAAGAPAGFVMPRVDLTAAVGMELLLSGRGRRAARLPEAYCTRVAVAHNLAATVAALHAAGDYVIDLKPANVHVYRGSFFVALLDCDGFSIGPADAASGPGWKKIEPADGAARDGSPPARFPAHQYTDGYIAPEALRAKARPEALGEAQDRFALAVVLFQLLSGGYHPFQGVPRPGADVPTTDGERVAAGLYPYGRAPEVGPPPGSLYAAFDGATRALFDAAFDRKPADRPSAEAWRRHLAGLLRGGLQPCPRDPDHARFGDAACAMCPPQPTAPIRSEPSAARPSRRAHAPEAMSLGKLYAMIAAIACVVVALLLLINALAPDELGDAEPGAAPSLDGALDAALVAGDAAGVRDALARGARLDRNVRTDMRPIVGLYTPLDEAVGYPAPVGRSQRCGAELNASSAPYVHWAAYAHRAGLLAALLDGGADPDVQDRSWRTALMWAARNCGPAFPLTSDMVDGLLAVGLQAQRSGRPVSPKDLSSRPALFGAIDSARVARRRLGAPDALSSGAADVAALAQNVAVVAELLTRRPDLDARDAQRRTALAYAAASGNAATVRYLLDAGAPPDSADIMGVTPLMVAADQAASPWSDAVAASVVRELLAGGADPSVQDKAGRTAADYVGERDATRRGKLDREGPRLDRTREGAVRGGDIGHGYASLDTLRLTESATLAVLRAATDPGVRRDRAALEGASRQPVARPERSPADLGDGPTAVSKERDPGPYDAPRVKPPWTQRPAPEVACDPALAGALRVTLTLDRWGNEGTSRRNFDAPLWSPDWGRLSRTTPNSPPLNAEKRACLSRIQRLFEAWYDVRDEPERWPTQTFTVRVRPEADDGR